MIVCVEGPRSSGKTYLLNKFFEQNDDPRVVYYKWYLVDWIEKLGLKNREMRGDVHYLSVGNILTVFDYMKDRNDKILVFDRALITAYVWANLRQRISVPQCHDELERIIKSDIYTNIHQVYVNQNLMVKPPERQPKDLWDNMHSIKEEYDLYEDLMIQNRHILQNRMKGNFVHEIHNEFNVESEQIFIGLMNSLKELINT